MSELGGFARLSLNQQAEMIRNVSVLVARRETTFCFVELYALDTLFIEFYFLKYRQSALVEKIKYINNTEGLQPYLEHINLPL
jgi:hypothetical protein